MKYDFIVVGGGPAGCSLAYRLSRSPSAPSVLLLEAGGNNDDIEATRISDRFATFMTHPHYNWNYNTVPQKHAANREINYARGKGLGGSSAINFCLWTRGPKDDFDEWARRVGDDYFGWENAEQRFKKIEGYQTSKNPLHAKYANWRPEDHGTDGPVKISDSEEWECHQESGLLAAFDQGWKKNPDGNSGDPLGIFVGATTGSRARRMTAKTAYLDHAPSNLAIVIEAPATKILFEGKKAVGIHAGGKDYFAGKEVILSAGALDTPKLLMLSGVGPKSELEKHNIPLLLDSPVGVGLQDHVHVPMSLQLKDGHHTRAQWSAPEAMESAKAQFAKDGTGPLSVMYSSLVVGFSKGAPSIYESEEFKSLPKDIQTYIQKPTIPAFESMAMVPTYPTPGFDPANTYVSVLAFGMVPQSRGTVTLKSTDPSDPPLCDPEFLSHPFDRKTLIDGVRTTFQWLKSPIYAPDPVASFFTPKSESDEDILEFIQQGAMSTWHMTSTTMMGKPDDEAAVVTTDFKVKGLEGLRIADAGVLPFVPNCHTVSYAYLIGETAAERIIKELGL